MLQIYWDKYKQDISHETADKLYQLLSDSQ